MLQTGEFSEGFPDFIGIAAKELRAYGVDEARVELIVLAFKLHVKMHRIVVRDHGLSRFCVKRGHVVSDKEIVAGLLV